MQHARGFIVGCANGWLWSPGRQSTPNSKLGKLFINKNHTISILHTGYKVIGYMFAKQSYWYKLRGLLFKLRCPRAFYWVYIDWLAPGQPVAVGNPTSSRETETQVPAACQPQPRQPHIIKLISQLQKPTRKTSDTWIIDTGKRETRYRLVKIHQTIRQPHKFMTFLSTVDLSLLLSGTSGSYQYLLS